MDVATLDSYLTVTAGTLTLTADVIPGTHLGLLLKEYNGGQPLVVGDAVKRPVQPSDTSVTIDGTVTMLSSQLGVTAVFAIDGDAVIVTLRMPLSTSPRGWTFHDAFPSMPMFKGTWNDGTQVPQGDVLDSIGLTDAALVLTNRAGVDSVLGAPLVPGLNVVGNCHPLSLLGPVGTLLGSLAPQVVTGAIHLPVPGQVVPPLAVGTWPWDAATAVPGIDLGIDLGSTPAVPGTQVSLENVCARVYTPTDATWAAANPSYTPTVAVTATVTVATNLDLTLTAVVGPNLDTLTLQAGFSGFSLENLAALAGITGSADLFQALPATLQKGVGTLGELSLVAAGLELTRAGGAVTLSMVYASVGLPTLDLDIGVGKLTGLVAHFAVATPFGTPSLDVQIEGTGTIPSLRHATFDVTVDVSTGDAWGTLSDATLPLRTLFHDLGLPPPSDLTIDSAEIEVSTSGSVAFNATVADDPPWSLTVGGSPVTISNVVLTAAKSSGSTGTASVAGQLALSSDLVLTFGYDLPGDFQLLGTFPDTTLRKLLAALDLSFTLPKGFDLTFEETWAALTEQGGTLQLTAATTVESVGLFEFVTRGSSGTFGFAAGVDLDVAGIGALPGLSDLAAFEQFVGLTNLMVVVSSITDPGFRFPDLSAFPAPALAFGGRNVVLPQQAAGGVTPGIVVYGSVSAASSKPLRAIGKWLGVPFDGTLGAFVDVALPDPANGSRLAFSVSGEVDCVLVAGQLGASLQGGIPTLYLTGTATAKIQGQPVVFALSVAVEKNGVFVSGGYTGTITFTVDGHGISLSNVSLAVGLDWEDEPSLGVAATIDIGNFDASVAVLLDSVDPAQSMFAGSVSDVTLADVATALSGSPLPDAIASVLTHIGIRGLAAFTLPASAAIALDTRDLAKVAAAFQRFDPIPSSSGQVLLVTNTAGSSWHLTDLTTMTHYTLSLGDDVVNVAKEAQIYCAPVATTIGPNTFPAGFHVDAAVDLLFLDVPTLRVDVSPGKGVAADIDLAPIIVGGPSFFAVTGAGGSGGPALSIATFAQTADQEPDPKRQPPHVLVSGAATFLGETVAGIYLDASPSGLQFEVKEAFGPVGVDVSGTVTSAGDLAAKGTVITGVKGTVDLGRLGSVPVDAHASGTLTMTCAGGSASAGVAATADLPGLGKLHLPSFTLDVHRSLSSLPADVWSEIENAYKTAVQSPEHWLTLVAHGVVSGVKDAAYVGLILASSFGLAVDAIGVLVHGAGYAAKDVAEAMHAAGAAAEDIAKALTSFGYEEDVLDDALRLFTTHADFGLGHIDTPKLHMDVHWDTGFSIHSDASVIPHGDTGTHVDT